jgi:hypothetical protein
MSENGQRLDGRMPNVGGMDARCKIGYSATIWMRTARQSG